MPTDFGTIEVARQILEHRCPLGPQVKAPDEAVVGLPLRLRHQIGGDDIENIGEVIGEAEPLRHLLGVLAGAVGEDVFPARQPLDRRAELGVRLHHRMVDVVHEFKKFVRIDVVVQHQSAERRPVLFVEGFWIVSASSASTLRSWRT